MGNLRHDMVEEALNSHLYDKVLSPFYDWLTSKLWPRWLHPNVVTLLGGLWAILSNVLCIAGQWRLAGLAFTLYHMCARSPRLLHRASHAARQCLSLVFEFLFQGE